MTTAPISSKAPAASIRIVVADDQTLLADALAQLLDWEDGIEVVGVAHDGPEAWQLICRVRPDVALLDFEMPGMTGLEVAEQINSHLPDCHVIMLTTFGRPGLLRKALELRVSGFLDKDSEVEEVASAIRRVVAGERVIDGFLAVTALTAPINPLTDRERDVLRAAKYGAPLKDVADALFLAPGTVRNYLSSAITKVGARTRVEAARIAADNDWL